MGFPIPNFTIDLSGQTALVTGASSGLGLRFAKVLAAAGANVALAARRLDRLEVLAADMRSSGKVAHAFRMDVAEPAQMIKVVGDVEATLGPVTILVNNAGIPDAQWAVKMAVEQIDRVLAVNLRAPYILSCEVAKRLIAQKLSGRIVNISSASAFYYSGNGSALYATTKAAIIRLTETLAVEWARFGINVNAIAPGAFASEMMDGMLQRVGDITNEFPRKRLGMPEQLDSTLLYLVSPSSEFVTGTCVRVDDVQRHR
jgi:NAD(P)-dependent dehydrogenase (short-subunit alcohol dehydrogenase family)